MNEMQNKLLNILVWFHGICERRSALLLAWRNDFGCHTS